MTYQKLDRRPLIQIRVLTSINLHTEALLKLADIMGDEYSTVTLQVVQRRHRERGQLTPDLKETRDEVAFRLGEEARRRFSPEDYAAIHAAL